MWSALADPNWRGCEGAFPPNPTRHHWTEALSYQWHPGHFLRPTCDKPNTSCREGDRSGALRSRLSAGPGMWFSRMASLARIGTDPERDEAFESGFLERGVSCELG
jgi:hypothetical protein